MSLTDFAENALLNHIFGNTTYTPSATVWVGLGQASAGETGAAFSEATYGSYARVIIGTGETATWTPATARVLIQAGVLTFPKSTSGDQTYSDYAIFDAASGGNMLAYGALTSDINVVVNSTPSIASTEVQISVNAGSTTGMSTYCANATLNFMFDNGTFAVPSLRVGLATATLSDASTGTTMADPSTNAYARTTFADWTSATTGTLNNNTAIQFATPSGTWGTITSVGLCDAVTNGNLLMYDNANVVDQVVGLNDDVKFLANQFIVSLN
jgi:hypothetical protein